MNPGGLIGASHEAKNVVIYLVIAAGFGLAGYAYWRYEKHRVVTARADGVEVEVAIYKRTQKVCFGLVAALCLFVLAQSFRWRSADFGWGATALLTGFVAAAWASLLFGGLLISLAAGQRSRWKARIGVWVAMALAVGITIPIASSNGPMKTRFALQRSGFDRLARNMRQLCADETPNHPDEPEFILRPPFSRPMNGPVDVKEIRCSIATPEAVEFHAGTTFFFLSSERVGFSTRRPENNPGDTRTDLALSGGWWYWTEFTGF